MLEVDMKTTIRTLAHMGHSKTHIAKTLSIDRKTVRKVLNEPENTPESMEAEQQVAGVKGWPSMLDEYREYIEIQMAKELSVVRIYQDIQREYGVECGYSTLRDYVRKLKNITPHPYMVLHSMPGEEAQVDFGYIGTVVVAGRRKKAWVFVMSLSYSRYMYAQITLDQTIQTFISCHIKAFRFFDGVPQTLKIDNLKAGIIEADFYEPTVQRTYAEFAKHYGFLPNPCRVNTPTDKGKIESNIKYVKENCFKGREFANIEEAREFLSQWLANIANKRLHGTTKKKPAEQYLAHEKGRLGKLPAEDFQFSRSNTATVRTDCHINHVGNYYSVPYTYIGIEVNIIEVNSILRIYYQGKEIAIHSVARDVKGEFVTNKEHYPSFKNITQEEILASHREKMGRIGTGAAAFFEAFCETEAYHCHHYRSISGILAL